MFSVYSRFLSASTITAQHASILVVSTGACHDRRPVAKRHRAAYHSDDQQSVHVAVTSRWSFVHSLTNNAASLHTQTDNIISSL